MKRTIYNQINLKRDSRQEISDTGTTAGLLERYPNTLEDTRIDSMFNNASDFDFPVLVDMSIVALVLGTYKKLKKTIGILTTVLSKRNAEVHRSLV